MISLTWVVCVLLFNVSISTVLIQRHEALHYYVLFTCISHLLLHMCSVHSLCKLNVERTVNEEKKRSLAIWDAFSSKFICYCTTGDNETTLTYLVQESNSLLSEGKAYPYRWSYSYQKKKIVGTFSHSEWSFCN